MRLGYYLCKISSSVKNGCRFSTLWHHQVWTMLGLPLSEARLAEDGISRYDLGREKFLEGLGMERREYATTIKEPVRADGALCRLLVSVSPLMKGCQKPFMQGLYRLYKKNGSTVVNLSSAGIQKAHGPLWYRSYSQGYWKVPSTTWTTCWEDGSHYSNNNMQTMGIVCSS